MLRNTPDNETLIVEYGFADSTSDDVDQIKNNWKTLAEAVVKALASYIGVAYTAPENTSPKNDNDSYYTVKKGDSLWSIAKEYGVTVNDLMVLNNLSTTLLQVGQKLKIKSVNNEYYVVKSGDNLWNIANKYNTSVSNLKNINNLNSDILQIGQKLIIPSNQTYIVKKGDSLWSIANKYGTTVSKLMELNNLTTNILQIGQKIIIN